MSLTLTAFDLDTLTFSICANDIVAWKNLFETSQGYEENFEYPYASGYNGSTLCSSVSVDWGVESVCTSAISLTTISDSSTLILCAYDADNPTVSAVHFFNPYHLYIQQERLSDNTLSATAWLQQVSTNNIRPINSNYNITWYTYPYTTHLSLISSTVQDFNQNFEGTPTDLSTIFLSSNSSDYQTFQLNITSPNTISLYSTNIIINGPISVQVNEASTSYIKLSAIQYNSGLNLDKILIWNIDPFVSGIETISANNKEPLVFNTAYSALCADWITLSTSNLTNSYLYTLSTYTGVVSGNFRPYYNTTNNTTLSTTIITIEDNVQEHEYLLNVHGLTNGVIHNLPESEYLVWNNTTSDIGVYTKKVDDTVYNFTNIDTVNKIDQIKLYIIPNTTTTYPKLCTYGFSVCALSGSTTNDARRYGNFTIQLQEWLSAGLFLPQFTIQYEPITLNTLYRPLTSAVYRITNDSILPPNSVGNLIYTFDDVVSTIPYNTITGVAPSEIYHNFNGLTPCICSVNLTVETSSVNYSNYVTRDAIGKSIYFIDFPVASNFIVYPEYVWDGSTWGLVVSNDGVILSSDVGLSAYSFCHTENFFVSSDDLKATQYIWSIQSTLDNSDQTITTVYTPTGFLPIVTPAGTTTHSICAAFYTSALPITMPVVYFDNIIGQKYPNFSTTFELPTSQHHKHIDFYGIDSAGLIPEIRNIETNPAGIPSDIYLTGGYTYNGGINNNTPFNFYMGSFTFRLSSNYSQSDKNASLIGDIATSVVYINVDDIGSGQLSVPKYEINNIDVIPMMGITPQLKVPHPSALENTWCFKNVDLSSYNTRQTVTVYPSLPLIYAPNKYILTGIDVKFENLVNCFSGIKDFTWTDRGNNIIESTCVSYTTSFDLQGVADLTLTTQFSGHRGIVTLTNEFPNIVNIDPIYNSYDSNINRVYQETELVLPHDVDDCSIGANDWLVADTFNTSMTKLYNNLTYLQYMSYLYDVPPTEYYGWLGTSYYANSSKHFRWYVNSPNINYGYNTPSIAIDDKFTTLKDVFVKENIMYVSNGTTVSVLSSDFRATTLGTIAYKSIGDSFTNIKAIKLDSDNRIYLLDTIDENNLLNSSKNRVIVFDFNNDTGKWTLLHGWGGLGGANSRTKFNNPNDLYVDKLNNIWIVDTGNKAVKKFTRTGSWLLTVKSEEFTNDSPLSVIIDENDYIQVLTTSKIVTFDSLGNYLNTTTLNNIGAKTFRECKDEGFAYICYNDKIVKYMYTEGTQAIFATNDFVNYSENYQNVYHDEFRNLYIVGSNHILKYIDKLFLINLGQDITGKMWPLSSLYVNKNEYICDWVVNRCLNRFWDNLEIFRKSLLGKFSYQTVQNVTTVTMISSVMVPEDFNHCDYDYLYGNGQYLTTDVIFEYLKPVVRTFTPEEYKILPYTKDQIYIGINELVSNPVLNRPIKKLVECQETILEMIT